MNYAIIENGTVTNIIVGPLPDGMDGVALFDRPVAIGDRYENGEFVKLTPLPEPSIEDQIASLEMRLAALKAQL